MIPGTRALVTTGALLAGLIAMPAAASAQVRPPVITSVEPFGLQRGTPTTFIVEGTNLAGATEVLFSDQGLTAKIDRIEELGPDVPKRSPGDTGAPIVDKATKTRVTMTVSSTPVVPRGRQGFRLRTPLGTTTLMTIWVGHLPEAREAEPNDAVASAQALEIPVTVNGVILTEGDADWYRVEGRAGQSLVFAVNAVPLGSRLDGVLTIADAKGRTLETLDDFNGGRDPVLVYTPKSNGPLFVKVSDAAGTWSNRHIYRLTIGDLPFVSRVFPLGRPRGGGPVEMTGVNLPSTTGRLTPAGGDRPSRAAVALDAAGAEPIVRVEAALGRYPEQMERAASASPQQVPVPITINGRVEDDQGAAEVDRYRFRARKGDTLVVRVEAARLGSPLDSVIEIVDASGRPVPRAVLRPVWQTTVDLRNHGSLSDGIRLLDWSALRQGDWVYVDRELLRVRELPKGPDEDVRFASYRGRRHGFLDTTNEAHALLRPVYKVEVHPPGTSFSPNGLPLFDLVYRNDDGTVMDGKDSRLTFTAPASGAYEVRVTDSRGQGGPAHAYRLTIAPPAPDFDLYVSPANPNVPRGGRVPVTVFAWREDGFDGAIDVEMRGLPPGLTATRGRILPGQDSVTLTIAAEDAAADLTAPVSVAGRATIDGRAVERTARADEPVSVVATAAPPDVRVAAVTPAVLELAPGGRAIVRAEIVRANGFAGRVPLGVRNLPFKVTVPDIGLNGILITEDQHQRSFEIVVDEDAPPAEQTLYVTARVETNSSPASEHASAPVRLRIVERTARRE